MSLIHKENPLLANILSQGLVQLANYLVPLLVIPYVTRVLGPEQFGSACYAQNIVAYLTMLVNFGFGISATQEVAIHKEEHEKLNSIFWNVILFKTFLLIVSFLILLALYMAMPKVHNNSFLFFAAAIFNVGTVLFPYWFFQGVERMVKMSMFLLAARTIGTVFIFIFVNSPEHTIYYLLALSLSNVFVGVVAFLYVVRLYKFHFVWTGSFCKSMVVRKSVPAFINSFFVDCNMLVGVTILGFYLSDFDLGIYSGAQKLMTAVLMVVGQPISLALFPRISRIYAENRVEGYRYLKRCFMGVALVSAIITVAVYALSPLVVDLMLGGKFHNSIDLIRLLAPLPLLFALATTLTMQGIFGLQLQKYAPLVGICVFFSNLLASYFLVKQYGADGAAYAWMICQIVEIVIDICLISKHRPR